MPRGLEQLRVYQAYPQPGGWSEKKHLVSVTALTPSHGVVENDVDSDGKVFRWTAKHLTPGRESSRVAIRFCQPTEALTKRSLQPGSRHSLQVGRIARILRRDSPCDTLREFSHWIYRNNRYVGRCSHRQSAAATTLRLGQGHCGHHAFLYREFCRELAFSCRIVGGYRLAKDSEMWSERDDWNRHYWVEVLMLKVGWVEVGPRSSGDPFFLPSTLIRNPSFPSQVIWANSDFFQINFVTY